MLTLCTVSLMPILCPVGICSLLVGFVIAILAASREAIAHLRRLHQIPCTRCAYFTGCHYLKCTVNPSLALTEAAIACRDFEPTAQTPALLCARCPK